MRNQETNIMNKYLLHFSGAGAMVWRNNTGKFRSLTDPQRIVTVGQVGSADIIGVQPVTITPEMVGKVIGQAIAIEVKTPTGKQSQEQKNWQQAFEERGGIYILGRGV